MRIDRREALILCAAGLAAAVAGSLIGVLTLQSRTGAVALLAQTHRDLAGRPRRLLEWQGKILVCNFWATWCAPCREEIPLLIAAQQQFNDKNVQIVGIGVDQASNIIQFTKEFKIDYPILIADFEAVDTMKQLGNRAGGLPFTVIVDRQGSVAGSRLGALQPGELDKMLGSLLG